MPVPPRNISNKRWTITKIFILLLAIVAPEVIFWVAASELYSTIILQKACNVVQSTRDSDSSEPKLWLSKRAIPLGQAQGLDHIDLDPVHTDWTFRQCFCIDSGGVALQTQDEWIYRLRPEDMKPLIQAGIIRCSDFRDRDVEDRAKSDSFGKAFTVLQSTWFLCNCIGRWAYSLPVSPIEIATVAYVCCGILICGVWWYKPKNVTTPICIYLRFDRKDLPTEVCNLTKGNPKGWVHLRARVKEESILSAFKTFLTLFNNATSPATSDGPDQSHNNERDDHSPLERPSYGILFSATCTSAALIFCAIHIAV
ncbi:uncharacterized protein N7483_011720 [Penicillium malachiteum]|uniref:uncharacterized protein n=1 Tax=Penicillium malachiteum TaxID=1324776 RepID=UPI002547082B|nr:uncharacterized protein N7483_011720 [Penicillium malachiteum]KAJ5714539.1 hypothetical protein N7483_011720 [Penicillium malachiteum]